MADDTVLAGAAGNSPIQTFRNTVGGTANVETQAVAIVDQFGVPITSRAVVGDVAAGAADAGNPVKVGGRAFAAAPTPVASGQRVDGWLDTFGRRVVSDFDPELMLATGITSYRERVVAPRYGVLVDSIADGLAAFWTQTTANGGTVAIAGGEGTIASGTTATGSAQIVSTAPAYLPGQSAWLLCAGRFGDTGSAGNVRRIGVFTVAGTAPQDGFYYELAADSSFNAVSVKAGVATPVASGAWSRAAVAPFTLDLNYHLFEIRWTANRADFYVDGVLRHSATITTAPITTTLNLPMAVQSISTTGTTSRAVMVRNIGMGRFGFPDTVTVQGNQPAATTGNITGAASVVGPITVTGYGMVTVSMSGTFVNVTANFEVSNNGTDWYIATGKLSYGGISSAFYNQGTSTVFADIALGGWTLFRVRASTWTSGTAVIGITPKSASYTPVAAVQAAGATVSGQAIFSPQPVLVGGSDGTNAQILTVRAPSSAAVAADPALVVAISPNNAVVNVGDVANAVADTGAPQKIGGQARITNPTAVADGQRVNATFDKLGRQIVVGAARELKARQRTNIAASTAETTIVTAVASTFNDLYGLVVTNNGTATMAVTIRDVAAGTPVMVFEVPATDTRGIMLTVDSAIPQATVNSAWTAACTPNATSADITALFVRNT